MKYCSSRRNPLLGPRWESWPPPFSHLAQFQRWVKKKVYQFCSRFLVFVFLEKIKADLNQGILFFTEESTPWSKTGIMASTLLPSCPIPEMGEEKSLPILQQVFSFCLLGENKSRFKSRNIVLHGGIHSLVQDGNHGLHPSPILPDSRDG